MSTMEEAKNKSLVLKAFDTLFNKRDYAKAESFWSPDYIQHSAHIAPGRTGLFDPVKSAPANPTGVAVTAVPVDCDASPATIDATGRRDCDDNACTIGDACAAGMCQPGSPLTAGVLSDVILERSDHVAAGTCAADKKKRVKKVLAPLSKTGKRLRSAFRTDNPSRARKKILAAEGTHEQAAKSLPKQQSHLSAACVAELNAKI